MPETLVSEVVRTKLDVALAGAGRDAETLLAIAQRAYQIAEKRGFAPGRKLDDWLQAERELGGVTKHAPPEGQFTG